ncbi:TetR/AcrR family transcriptional regulator [Agromyces aurantiacus]|uniref:TetR/AcrR family transcriptional regulator n=1 Tax=Agromyces aurantiacus TaxID=165814 RepID=A0ABV9R2J4_9MICO|nr:TetR family transcriptional regulator [Agromyces aurantiacus]MBM7505964.1 AcrR family transcriptional regulator [Agromyces aurantiacus]
MPIEVDTSERLADIARATIEVASERGTQAVTLRAVAERLGRSTAYITNFVPSRADLMANALEHARARWDEERRAHLGERVGVERLAELARWMCSTSPEEQVLRSLWVEVIADVHGANRRAYEVVRSVTDATYEKFLAGAGEVRAGSGAGRGDGDGDATVDRTEAARIADILYLYCRGSEVKSIEDPAAWTDARMQDSLELLLDSLVFRRA